MQESRATEFRQKLSEWRQMPVSSRPSLRALAYELGTSHQLLGHYLKEWDKWQSKEYWRQATEIRARAIAEGRLLTQWEEQQVNAYTGAAIRTIVLPALLENIEQIKQDAKRGPLHRAQFKMLKIFAKQGFPGAQDLLRKCSQDGLRKRKRFAEIVKETPRQEGETYIAWVRRIWDQCAKYDTDCPAAVTEELLQGCSQGSPKNEKNNLPPIPSGAAKSFRTVQGKSEECWQLL